MFVDTLRNLVSPKLRRSLNIARIVNAFQVTLWLPVINPQYRD